MIDDDEDEDEDEDDRDFAETELDRSAGDYGDQHEASRGPPRDQEASRDPDDAELDSPTATMPVESSPALVARHDREPPKLALVQPRARVAKTAPLLPAQRPAEMEADDDVAPTALDRDVMDPARPPRGSAARAPKHAGGHQPAPPLSVPASDLGLKLALAGLIALTVILLVALAVGVAISSCDAEESGDEAPSRDWRTPRD